MHSDWAGHAARAIQRLLSRRRLSTSHFDHVLGTSMDLRVATSRKAAAQLAETHVLEEVQRLEALLSGWSQHSELAHWNKTRDTAEHVSNELAELLALSESWRHMSKGAFDPGIAEVIAALEGDSDEATAESVRTLASESPRWIVDRDRNTARRLCNCRISLDAIAKGFIVTRAAERAFEIEGVDEVLLNIGGDVQHLGSGRVAVGIANPFRPSDNGSPIAVVHIRNEALATSGNYRRAIEVDGEIVSHIVDPRTGLPASGIVSASVLAPEGTTADALSTAFSVMSPDESIALANSLPGVGCMLIERDGTLRANAVWTSHERTRDVN